MFSRILVPTDFSPASDAALEYARILAARFGSSLRILHVIDDPTAVLDFYLEHRQERLDQVRAAVAAGHTTPEAVVEHVYSDVDRTLWPAAERSVRAQLDYLAN